MVEKIDPVWASDGTSGYVVTPPTGQIERGWAPGDQPANSYENWRANRLEVKINEVIDDEKLRTENDFFDTIYDRCSGLPNAKQILHPKNASNTKVAPFGAMCRGIDLATSQEVIFAVAQSDPTQLYVIHNQWETDDDWAYESITLGGLGSPISSDDNLVDICCDGYYIYIAINLEDGSASAIYKYRLSADDYVETDYVAKIQFGSAEVFIDTESWTQYPLGSRQLIVADDDNLAFIDYTNQRIGIVGKALDTAPTYGTGAAPSGATYYPRALCSDGTRIWTICKYSNMDFLVPHLISDPTDTTGGITRAATTLHMRDVTTYYNAFDIAWDGMQLHVISGYYRAGAHAIYDNTFDPENEIWCPECVKLSSGTVANGRMFASAVTFTGRQIAVACPVCPVTDLSTGSLFTIYNRSQKGLALFPCDIAYFSTPDTYGGSGTESANFPETNVLALENNAVDASNYIFIGGITFADDCAWVLTHKFVIATGVQSSTYLVRIPAISRR